jgi:hypothetical protein
MENSKAIGLALIIAGVAGGVIYYLYVRKKPDVSPTVTPESTPTATPTPTPTPNPRVDRTAVKQRPQKYSSVPQISTGLKPVQVNVGAISTSLIR